jgi:hypothetical protein
MRDMNNKYQAVVMCPMRVSNRLKGKLEEHLLIMILTNQLFLENALRPLVIIT